VDGGPRDEATLRRDNLPSELTTFIGRDAELDEVARLLRRAPLVTLTGAAGCGKTRLALEIAARQRDEYHDGVWLVELAPLSEPDLVPDAVVAALEVKLGRRSPVEAALVESLATTEALIVLDNCEHLVDACAHLAETLLRGCPGLQVLATSREPLAVTGEIVWRVPSLTLPTPGREPAPEKLLRSEAVRLFVDRAGAAQPGFALTDRNAAGVAQICRRLDGVPLAIELAAARVGSLPPLEIARRLGESFRLLQQERRTAEMRQQTLEAALDWSYRLLDDEEGTLLRRLAVFAGAFGLDAAEEVCAGDGLPGADVVDVLVRLVSKSLVVAEDAEGQPRYRLLEMVRQYAHERLREASESDALAERHALWYLDLPERAGSGGETADAAKTRLGRLDLETDNLRAALRWLLDHDPPEALSLAGSLSDWWLLRGRLAEGREWLETGVERAPEDSPAVAEALLRSVPFAARGGDMVRGSQLAERSLSIYRKLGDREGMSRALHMLGLQSWLRGAFPRASEQLAATIEEAQLAGSAPAEANAAHALGMLAVSTRDLPGARTWPERALALLASCRRSPRSLSAASSDRGRRPPTCG
jgi:predicted ATPase